jgi:galactose mutarotase-like enzyme
MTSVAVTGLGANVLSLKLGGRDILWHKGKNESGEILKLVDDAGSPLPGGMPFMFPWTSRLEKGQFQKLNGTVVDLTGSTLARKWNRPDSEVVHALHGMTNKIKWEIERAEADAEHGAQVSLLLDTSLYPDLLNNFGHFKIRITHQLQGGKLTTNTEITSFDSVDRKVGFGLHPFYVLPGRDKNEWQVRNTGSLYWKTDADQVPLKESPATVEANSAQDIHTLTEINRGFETSYTGLTPDESGFVLAT